METHAGDSCSPYVLDMCGRFTLATPAAEWAALFDVEPLGVAPRFNIAPTDDIVVVRKRFDTDAREAVLLRWGLIPEWTRTPSDLPLLINARCETIGKKPSFRDAFRHRRALVIADGFYEWKPGPGGKRPFWIHLPEGVPFAMAALWDRWPASGGAEPIESCAIVTTAASADLADIHDRMPVVLDSGQVSRWLDPQCPAEELSGLMGPVEEGRFRLREVSPRVNSVRNDDASCLAPTDSQSSLFD